MPFSSIVRSPNITYDNLSNVANAGHTIAQDAKSNKENRNSSNKR